MKFDTAILLITFNRPEYTRKVLTEIMFQLPEQLYIFQDAPREGNMEDVRKCEAVRKVIDDLTNGKAKLFIPEHNLGCGPGPAAALTWFFSEVEQGLIFEDDAVPSPEFFEYASQLLERYKNDKDVRAIGSMNVDTQQWGDGSYYFSMMNRNLCAWATWRRAWQDFDIRLMGISRIQLSHALKRYGCGPLERKYWCDRLDEVHKDGVGGASWDMQFFMSIWLKHGKGIIPHVNLSSNIGTVGDATHGMSAGNLIDNVPTRPILPLTHPTSKEIQYEADRSFHFRYFESGKASWNKSKIVYYLTNSAIKRLVGHQGPWLKRRHQ